MWRAIFFPAKISITKHTNILPRSAVSELKIKNGGLMAQEGGKHLHDIWSDLNSLKPWFLLTFKAVFTTAADDILFNFVLYFS